jgi:uncharacterized membrane protein
VRTRYGARGEVRLLQVEVAPEQEARALEIAEDHGAVGPMGLSARRGDGQRQSLVLVRLTNRRVGEFIEAVDRELDDVRITLLPVGTLPIESPVSELREEVSDVSRLSTAELVLGSAQSIGSWSGLLIYSVLAALIGAYGIIFDVSYLLVAAMLINPMGAPAIVAVIGLTLGSGRMFYRGGLRFGASLLVQALAAAILGLSYGLDFSTESMERITSLSMLAPLLAAAAGAAGAQSQVKADRASLVSGTAAGFMVAAALAPPAAVLGLSVTIARWDYLALMSFTLALQFLAIGVGGWMVLAYSGVRPSRPALGRGSSPTRTILLGTTTALVVLAVAWQYSRAPTYQRADLSRDAVRLVREVVDASPEVGLVEVGARFTRDDLERYDQETLIVELTVERLVAGDDPESALRSRISDAITSRIPGVLPFVDITVLPSMERFP